MHISYYMWCIQPDILWEVILFCPDNCLSTKNIQYRWDRMSWCVGIILQRERKTPGVISLCHKMTLHMSVREPLYDVNKTLTEAFHDMILQLSFHNPNTDIVLHWTEPEICVTSWEVSLLHPSKGLTNTCIQYRWDRIAWCVGVIFQHEGRTPRVIILYHLMTPHKSVGGGGGRITWNEHSWDYSIIIWHLCHRCHRFPWPTGDIMQLKTRVSGVMSLYIRTSPHGSE